MIKDEILQAFDSEFGFIKEKFEIMDLLSNNIPMEDYPIRNLALPSENFNIVWYPGVYMFIGNNLLYRVGVSMRNSRARVLEHLNVGTSKGGHSILDIDKFDDKSILLINVKDKKDRHWLLSIELFFEERFNPLIKAGRKG